MRPSVLVVAGWVTATVAVTGVAVAGVQIVSSRVVEPLPPIAAADPSTPPSPTPSVSDPSPTPLVIDPTVSESPDPGQTVSPRPRTTPPRPTSSPSPTSTPTPTTSPTDDDDDDDEPAASELRSYSVVGGSVTLRFSPGKVEVVSVQPNPGFSVDIEGDGTAEASVKLESESHESRVKGWWEAGHGPRDEVREDADD